MTESCHMTSACTLWHACTHTQTHIFHLSNIYTDTYTQSAEIWIYI